MEYYGVENRKRKVEELFVKFGAKKTDLRSGECWALNGLFFRVDSINFCSKPFLAIEIAENIGYAENNCFEDADPFPYDLSEEELINEVKFALFGYT